MAHSIHILAFNVCKGHLFVYYSVFLSCICAFFLPQRQALGLDCVYHHVEYEAWIREAWVAPWEITVKCMLL